MPQDNQLPPQPQDNDLQDAYEAFKAYKAFKTRQSQVTPDAADKAARPTQEYLSPGESATNNYWTNVKSRITDPERWKAIAGMDSPAKPDTVGDDLGMAAGLSMPLESAPSAIAKIATYLGKAGVSPAVARVGANTAIGAGSGAINHPEDRLGGATRGGLISGVLATGGEVLSGPVGKIADYLMQSGVGLSKYFPGLGNLLVDMNVVGTKNMMANQVSAKLAAEEEALQGLVKDLNGTVNSQEIADAVAQKGQRFKLPSTGKASPFSESELQKVQGMTEKLSKMGNLTGEDLLALKRHGDYQGFTNSGTPATSTEALLGRTGADASRQALKKMAPEAADSLMREQALIQAQKGLMKPDSIHKSLGGMLLFGKVPGQSVLTSAGAQALQKGIAQPASLFSNPLVNQTLTKKLQE